MAENTDNHTLKLLQEMRGDMKEMRSEMREFRTEVNDRFDGVDLRIDGMTHIITMLAGHHYQLEDRVTKLEVK